MHHKHSSSSKPSQATSAQHVDSPSKEDRQRMVAEAAYFHAQHRGFQGGDINDDWFRAESEIDAMFAKVKAH